MGFYLPSNIRNLNVVYLKITNNIVLENRYGSSLKFIFHPPVQDLKILGRPPLGFNNFFQAVHSVGEKRI